MLVEHYKQSEQFDEASKILYGQTGLSIVEVINMIRGLEKKVNGLEQSIRSLEEGQVEIHERIDNSNINKNTLERKVDTFINKIEPIFTKLRRGT